MNYFVQGNSNPFRINIDEEKVNDEEKSLSVNQLYIKLKKPQVIIKWCYGVIKDDIKSFSEEYKTIIVPDDNIWLKYNAEPFYISRESIDATNFILTIKYENESEEEDRGEWNTIKYMYNDVVYMADISTRSKYKAYHKFLDIKMVKVYLEFDEVIFNMIELTDRVYDKKLSFMLGTHLMMNDSFDVFPDIMDSSLIPSSFYMVIKDENDKLIEIDYILFSFKFN